MSLLNDNEFDCKVSSVLNKDVKQHGKMNMFDGKEDTCWASESQSPQSICISFKRPQLITSFDIQFQGGFVGQDCEITLYKEEDKSKSSQPFYPEDNNTIQSFSLQTHSVVRQIVLRFNKSSDFFGRIVIYNLSIYSG